MADPNSIIDTASNLGDLIAKANQDAAQGRAQAGMLNQSQALAAANIYRSQLDASLKGPTESARSTALGDTMANVKPFEWGDPKMVGNIPVPTGSGGLTPANFGPNTRQAGADLSNLSASRVNSPTFNLPTPPVLPPIPTQGGLSSALGTAGALANALKAANGSGGDIGKLLSNLFGRGNFGSFGGVTGDPNNDTGFLPSYDPSNPDNVSTPSTTTSDPSGGTNVGPGMQAYYEWLAQQEKPDGTNTGGPDGAQQPAWWEDY